MKIALIAPIVERVPPKKYGGTERVIYTLTESLVARGHDVTLFASGDSVTSAKLVSVLPKALREYNNINATELYGANAWTLLNIGLAYQMQDRFDVIHDHTDISAPTANLSKTPVVLTVHGAFNDQIRSLFGGLKNLNFASISQAQARRAPELPFVGNVYNGLFMEDYPFSPNKGNYLLFVGRISRQKGVHNAIAVAHRLKMPLIIAAKLETADKNDMEYFHSEVEPFLTDKIRWIGEVDEGERNELMKNAYCFIHALTWPEPFGLTLIESMACGTPVIAFSLGSIPEIIVDGKTGFVVNNIEEMVEAVKKIPQIDRVQCRRHALENFSGKKMAEGYEKVYEKIIKQKQQKEFINPEVIRDVIKDSYSVRSRQKTYALDVRPSLKQKQ